MTDDYFKVSRKSQLNIWIANQMMKGAGYAAAVVVGFGLILTVIWAVGQFLPEESKQSPDPNTWSAIAPVTVTAVA
ncbi:RC-LH1 core complex protein PufX [Tabrizicola sp. BL-A-41-H6]|uniref:RC-LH1 core complex protein PufX n=1 Tax=Tabrizicola sp. BL-A-41-H6 TaxID=3421107 RepID=UPI003D67D125